eukprot:TRINITY_DN4556_c0_g2_i1.p2 TRINITY_DN4556_c0_g2~~TRINITY_DN4556_c0_g2_i1.p2  ORF type:complete len:181 (-),score=47.08 TRINITY_DN4556_c0_g2_i1:427-933(-)
MSQSSQSTPLASTTPLYESEVAEIPDSQERNNDEIIPDSDDEESEFSNEILKQMSSLSSLSTPSPDTQSQTFNQQEARHIPSNPSATPPSTMSASSTISGSSSGDQPHQKRKYRQLSNSTRLMFDSMDSSSEDDDDDDDLLQPFATDPIRNTDSVAAKECKLCILFSM